MLKKLAHVIYTRILFQAQVERSLENMVDRNQNCKYVRKTVWYMKQENRTSPKTTPCIFALFLELLY